MLADHVTLYVPSGAMSPLIVQTIYFADVTTCRGVTKVSWKGVIREGVIEGVIRGVSGGVIRGGVSRCWENLLRTYLDKAVLHAAVPLSRS